MVNRPANMKAYEFVVLSSLRAQQLLAGCIPRLEGDHRAPTMAQMEVAGGYVTQILLKATTLVKFSEGCSVRL